MNMTDLGNIFCCSLQDIMKGSRAQELHGACKEYGYFYIENLTPNALPLEEVFCEAQRFFELPTVDKIQHKSLPSNQFLGYRGIGTEKSMMTGAPELCEQYKFGYLHDKKTNTSVLADSFLAAYKTIFTQYTRRYFQVMEQVATQILNIMAHNFNLGDDYFLPYCNQPMHQLGLNYYPIGNPEEQSEQNYAMSAHKDLCLLTIIAQSAPGLMAQDLQGHWRPIVHKPNTLIVMLGDYLQRWTNHYYLAPIHRVVESAQYARTSVIYKHRPNYDTVIPLIPGINFANTHHEAKEAFHTGKAYEEKITRIMGVVD